MQETILVLGDTHFMHNNEKSTNIMCEDFINIVKEKKPTFVIILGDFFDRHAEVNIFALYRGSNFLFELMDLCHVYILVGNHDMLNNKEFFPNAHSLYAYNRYQNITIVDKTLKVELTNDKFILLVPYVPPGSFMEALEYIEDWKNAKIIFAHQEFKGCIYGNIKSNTGDHWPEEYPQVISGHIHKRHKVQDNIYYPGSPLQVKVNDEEDRYICIVVFDENNNFLIKKKRIKSLIKRTVVLDIKDAYDYKPEKNVELRIKLVGNDKDNRELLETGIIKKWQNKGIKVITDIKSDKKIRKKETDYIEKDYRDFVYDTIKDNEKMVDIYKNKIMK